MSLDALKRASSAEFEQLADAAFKTTPAGKNQDYEKEEDPRFWSPRRDKAGNGFHIVRFLPAPAGESPWVEWWDHGFKGPTGKWYFERSLRTIGQPDPLSELNGALWKQGKDSPGQAQARAQKQKTHYTANVYVVSDGVNPENNGKVFMWIFGKKIFAKIAAAMRPEFPDDPKFNPFDLWTGATFKVKVRTVDEYANYDLSTFDPPSAFMNGDDHALGEIYKQVHSLKAEYKDPAKFKTYNELKMRLQEVLGVTPSALENTATLTQTMADPFKAPETSAAPQPAPQTASTPAPQPQPTAAAEDPMEVFKRLAAQATQS